MTSSSACARELGWLRTESPVRDLILPHGPQARERALRGHRLRQAETPAVALRPSAVRHSCKGIRPVQVTRRAWIGAAGILLARVEPLHAAEQESQALIFGTVFRDSYLALPGAKVVAYEDAKPRRKYRAVTNYRGEFRIRVPAGDATYVLEASAPKFALRRRTVEVYGIEKSTANIVLERRKSAARGGKPSKPDSED